MKITKEFLMDTGFTSWGETNCVFTISIRGGAVTLWKSHESDYSVTLFGLDLREHVYSQGDVDMLLQVVGFTSVNNVAMAAA